MRISFHNHHDMVQVQSLNKTRRLRKLLRAPKLWLVVVFLVSLIFFFFFLPNKQDKALHDVRGHGGAWRVKTATTTADVTQQAGPSTVVHREVLHGVDVLWQAPNDDKQGSFCGILVLLHGCHHSATDFWSNHEAGACRGECLGLPEERAIVQMGLQRGLIVVALSSQNRKSKCWKPHLDNKPVAAVLMELQQRWSSSDAVNNNLLPIIAFGASSGGYLVGQLDAALEAAGGHLDAFIAEIATGNPIHGQYTHCGVYITMNRDVHVDESVKDTVETILQQEQQNKDERFAIRHIRLPDLPLHDAFFSDRIGSDVYSPALSRRMVQALREGGHLDGENKLMNDPGRSDNWVSAIRPLVPAVAHDSLKKDESPVREVLRVAYGKHEMTRDGVVEALDFCLTKLERPPMCT